MASRIATFCAGYIGEHGPASVDELHQAARAAQVTTARTTSSVAQAVRYSDQFRHLPDGRYVTTNWLFTGSIFTHRARNDTREVNDQIWFGRELEPLRRLFGPTATTMPLAGGGEITSSRYYRNVWTGPKGWLPPVARDELLGLRWDGSGIQVTAVAGEEVSERRIEQVRTVLRRHDQQFKKSDGSSYRMPDSDGLVETVRSALLEVPDLLKSPVLPLDELLGSTPGDCVRELYRSLNDTFAPEYEARVTLSMPEPLLADFNQRAELTGADPKELMIAVLARAAHSSSPRDFLPPARRFPNPPYESDESWGGMVRYDEDPWGDPVYEPRDVPRDEPSDEPIGPSRGGLRAV
jgi:hypothetical protein